jgi:hypothetical protein
MLRLACADPSATSARLIVRRSIARNIADIADLYAAIINGVEQESEWDDQKHKDGELAKAKEARTALHTERFVRILVCRTFPLAETKS